LYYCPKLIYKRELVHKQLLFPMYLPAVYLYPTSWPGTDSSAGIIKKLLPARPVIPRTRGQGLGGVRCAHGRS